MCDQRMTYDLRSQPDRVFGHVNSLLPISQGVVECVELLSLHTQTVIGPRRIGIPSFIAKLAVLWIRLQ